MRFIRRDVRTESFYARRGSTGTYVPTSGGGLGAGARPLLFDLLQSDKTDGKIAFIPETLFRITAKDYETWCVQLIVSLAANSSGANYICPYLTGPGSQARNLAILTAVAATNNYVVPGEIIIALNPGESLSPALNSDNATNNNPSSACIFSGYRIG